MALPPTRRSTGPSWRAGDRADKPRLCIEPASGIASRPHARPAAAELSEMCRVVGAVTPVSAGPVRSSTFSRYWWPRGAARSPRSVHMWDRWMGGQWDQCRRASTVRALCGAAPLPCMCSASLCMTRASVYTDTLGVHKTSTYVCCGRVTMLLRACERPHLSLVGPIARSLDYSRTPERDF